MAHRDQTLPIEKTFVTLEWAQSASNVGISHFSSTFKLCGIECRLLARESLAVNQTSTIKSLTLSPQAFFRKRSSSSPIPPLFGRFSPTTASAGSPTRVSASSSKTSVVPPSYVSVYLDFLANSSNLAIVKGYSINFQSLTHEISPLFPSAAGKSSSSSSSRSESPSPAPSIFHDGRVFYTSTYIAESCFKPKSSNPSEGTIGFEVELSINEVGKVINVLINGWIPDTHHSTRLRNSSFSLPVDIGPRSFTPVSMCDESAADDSMNTNNSSSMSSPARSNSRSNSTGGGSGFELAMPIPLVPPSRAISNNTGSSTPMGGIAGMSRPPKSPHIPAPSSPSVAGAGVGVDSVEYVHGVIDTGLRMMCEYLLLPQSCVTLHKPLSAASSPGSAATMLSLSTESGCGSGPSSPPSWSLRVNRKNVDVYTAKLQHSCWQLIKAEAVIAATKEKIFNLLINDENLPQIDDMIDSVEPIMRVDDCTAVRRMKAKGVWPTDPRDFIVCTTFQDLPDGSVIIVSRSTSDELCPAKKGFVRGFVQVSGYWIQPQPAENGCKVTLLAHTELGGNLPATVINLLFVSAPLKIMQGIEKHTATATAGMTGL